MTSVPDQASFTFGVSTNAATAGAALTANAREMTKVIAALKAQQIASADIQTAEISLTPNMSRDGAKVINFTATNSVSVTTKSIAKAGAIVDQAVGAGANLVSGPSLTPSDASLLARKALKAAIADARARAETIAAAAKVKLGRVRTVTEESSGPVTSTPEAKVSFASTPVEPGTIKTEEDVTVTFDISWPLASA